MQGRCGGGGGGAVRFRPDMKSGGGVAARFRPDTKSGGRGCCPLQARYEKQGGGGDAVHCVCVCVCVCGWEGVCGEVCRGMECRVCVDGSVGRVDGSVGCVWMGV